MRLLPQYLDDLLRRARMAGRQVELAPRDAARGARGGIPRTMRVGKAHPHEPVLGIGERIEEGDGAVGDPVRVVVLARDRVVLGLRRAGVAAALGIEPALAEEREVAGALAGVVGVEPETVMIAAEGA